MVKKAKIQKRGQKNGGNEEGINTLTQKCWSGEDWKQEVGRCSVWVSTAKGEGTGGNFETNKRHSLIPKGHQRMMEMLPRKLPSQQWQEAEACGENKLHKLTGCHRRLVSSRYAVWHTFGFGWLIQDHK